MVVANANLKMWSKKQVVVSVEEILQDLIAGPEAHLRLHLVNTAGFDERSISKAVASKLNHQIEASFQAGFLSAFPSSVIPSTQDLLYFQPYMHHGDLP